VRPWRHLGVSVRVRLAGLVAAVFLLFGGALLGISYALVRSHLTVDPARIAEAIDPEQLERARGRQLQGQSQDAVFDQYRQIQEELAADDLAELTVQYLLILAGMTVLSGLLGWFVAGRALRPTADITATARRVSQESLHERIALEGPDDELKRLADTFDSMLGRLEAAFERQSAFVSSASHELRTPLAVIRTEAEVTLADEGDDPAALKRSLAVVREAGARSERLIDALLDLARADRADRPRTVLDLAQVVRERLDGLDLGHLRFDAQLAAAQTIGDRDLIRTLVANLLSNAVHHNVAGGWIAVSTSTTEERAVLEVSNSGDLITEGEAATLAEPFRRLSTVRTGPRLGLGLSIAQSIAQAHGSRLELAQVPGGGLRVRVAMVRAPRSRPKPLTSAPPRTVIVDRQVPSANRRSGRRRSEDRV
jgi:signal transduction histidine kinase